MILSIEPHGFAHERDTKQWNEKHGQILRIRHSAMSAALWKSRCGSPA